METRLARLVTSLVLDAALVLALMFPQLCAYLRWPLPAGYALLSWTLVMRVSRNRWIVTIVRDFETRIAHGLEHATIAVLREDGLPAIHGFTHWRNRFMVALPAGNAHQLAAVRDAATRAIQRIREGERALAYAPGCGTSEVVSVATLWLVYLTSLIFTIVVGGSVAILFPVSVLVFRCWLAFETPLSLLAQRLYTVSTAFTSARVVEISEVTNLRGYARPDDETWFEIVVRVQVAASEGGAVAPGALA